MRDLDAIFKDLKSYTEALAYNEKMMAEGKVAVVTPEQRRDTIELLCDTLAFLMRREPKCVVDIHKAFNNVLNPDVPWVGKCPKCGKKVEGRNLTRFCKYCGQAVKWE